jgi:hypothetical protein
LAVCGTSGWAADGNTMKDPFILISTVAGIVLLVAGVIGLFANTVPYLVVMMAATFVIWLTATTRHLVAAHSEPRPVPTA